MTNSTKQYRYFGEWLNRTLSNLDVSSTEVAKALGVSVGFVSRCRHGLARPGQKKCQKLAELLNIELMPLLVTAGHLEPEGVQCQPLPLPEDKDRRDRARKALMKVPGVRELKPHEIEQMIDRTMEFIDERTLGADAS